jgi:hypothetical protein
MVQQPSHLQQPTPFQHSLAIPYMQPQLHAGQFYFPDLHYQQVLIPVFHRPAPGNARPTTLNRVNKAGIQNSGSEASVDVGPRFS